MKSRLRWPVPVSASIPATSSWLTITGVTSLGDGAFRVGDGMAHLTLGNGVLSIGTEAFAACAEMPSLRMPDTVLSLGDRAFQVCTHLTEALSTNTGVGGTSVFGDPVWSNYPQRCFRLRLQQVKEGGMQAGFCLAAEGRPEAGQRYT